MRCVNLENHDVLIYDDVGDFIQTGRNHRHKRDFSTGCNFVGRNFSNLYAAYDAINRPWPNGVQWVREMVAELQTAGLPAPVSRRRKKRWGDCDGDHVDTDRLRAGQPYWLTTQRKFTTGPSKFTIILNMAARASQSSRGITYKAAAALALCDVLEERGYLVDIVAVETGKGTWDGNDGMAIDSTLGVPIKRAGERLDVEALINLTSGWCYRTAWFSALCDLHENPRIYRVSGVLGLPTRVTQEMIDLVTDGAAKTDGVVLFDSDITSKESAIDRLHAAMESLFDVSELIF